MMIGEGPGEVEDTTGRPFVGPAGQKLDEIIQSVGMRREDLYITNIVKCRPPGNRVSARSEAEACTPFLEAQIALIQPAVIVALGNTPTQWLLPDAPGITQSHGTFFAWRGGILVFPMYHPSYLLRYPSKEILHARLAFRLGNHVQLVEHQPARLRVQLRVVFLQFGDDRPRLLHRIDTVVERREVDHVQQQARALQVAQKLVAQAGAFARAFDQARHVGEIGRAHV
jgi:uracil-DNA glycosylase family 4